SGLLLAAVPLVGALLAWLTRSDERLGGRRLIGLFTGVLGVAILVGFDVGGGDLRAAGEIALVAICYAIGPLIIARKLNDLPAVAVLAGVVVLGEPCRPSTAAGFMLIIAGSYLATLRSRAPAAAPASELEAGSPAPA